MDSVPVAERLLQTKLFGVPVRRLGQAIALPLAPALLASIVGLELAVVGPLLVVGLGIGTLLFYRTPEGQSPVAWINGVGEWLLGPERCFWQPIRQDESSPVWLDRWRSTGKTRTVEATPPVSLSDPLLGSRNTIDGIDFDHVRDDGIIVTDSRYVRMLEIEPTPWLILDESARESTIQAFERYLAGVGSAIQFVSLPVPFDVDAHRRAVLDSSEDAGRDRSILQTGRHRHAAWLDRVVREGDVRDRRHFLVVSIPKGEQAQKLTESLSSGDSDAQESIDELDARADHARSSLPRTGATPTILDDRASVLAVLYRYYRGKKPPAEMDHGWLTRRGADEQ